MIPKSGNRFSEKIMLKRKLILVAGAVELGIVDRSVL
jgi:hypothetical protein